MVYVKIRTLGLGIVFSKLTSLRVHIFVFLSLVWQLCGVRETVKTWRGSWRELDKNGREGKGGSAPPSRPPCPNSLLVKHPITIKDGGMENLIYRAFHFCYPKT